VVDDQDSIDVEVWQGENKTASENNPVEYYIIDNLPKLPAGKAEIEVTFAMDAGGVLEVKVVDTSNRGNHVQGTILVPRTEVNFLSLLCVCVWFVDFYFYECCVCVLCVCCVCVVCVCVFVC